VLISSLTTVSLTIKSWLKVLVKRGEIPHLNQVARIVLRPGQIATENYHDDMSEIFYITSGTGTFRYDGQERAIKVTHHPFS
jgi:mannose-6-phosphate isomerase-like protein (cupin superfamily)